MLRPIPEILVVDEVQQQLDTVCRGLRLYGYESRGVLGAGAAWDALEEKGRAGYDLMLFDITELGAVGIALVIGARREWPRMQALALTGLSDSDEDRALHAMGVASLRKPFGPDALDAAVRSVLR